MKLVEGIIYTRDMEKLSKALEAKGLIVQEVIYDGRRVINSRVLKGIACIYNLINRVKIRTVINDDLIGTIMETLKGFGNCEFVIIPEDRFCLA
jgi:nitrogen regulatory protein PII